MKQVRNNQNTSALADTDVNPNSVIIGNGEMADLIRSFDWTHNPLGPIDAWPQSLVTTVNTILQSPVPIVMLWGSDGIMLYNDAYSVFAGLRHPRLLGSKVVEGWPEVADFNRNVMATVLTGGTLSYADQQLTLYRNDVPEEVWMDLNYSPIMDESGRPGGVLAIVVETTQRIQAEKRQKKAEDALRAERARLHSLFTDAPALIALLHGPDHVFTLANPIYMQLVGQRVLIGKPIREAMPELEGQGIYEILDNVYRTGEPYFGSEVPVKIDRDGKGDIQDGYFNFVYKPSCGESGEVDGILVHGVEVTDQVNARKRVEEIAALNKIITDNATTGLLIVDNNFHCTFMNPAAEQITGYTFKQVKKLRKSLHQLIHNTRPDGSYPPESECPIYKTLSKKTTMVGEDIFVRPDGSFYPVAFVANHIRQGNTSIGTVIEIRDLTEEKKAQEEQQRLISITNQRNELLVLNKAKDDFIAMASHQLRTPATAVKQYISLLQSNFSAPLLPEQMQYLQIAFDSNERQLKIINDLLITARIDASRYVLSKNKVDIVDIIKEAASDLQPALELKSQKILLSDMKRTEVLIDKNEIKLAFVNLIENASKYSHPGSEIKVYLGNEKDKVAITVEDQGVGISKADTLKIFDKFTRVDNELSDTVTGSGLGLYWVKRIVQLHGGTVRVSSEINKGSKFIVRLPI
ncbi:MAG: chemotaxis protein methyltransferase CheR [Candidatus Saccharibacteria bacterium]|nr:chemotaxis protein methyltransferase CheR [Candidatus Saccharibacteria bacterium]